MARGTPSQEGARPGPSRGRALLVGVDSAGLLGCGGGRGRLIDRVIGTGRTPLRAPQGERGHLEGGLVLRLVCHAGSVPRQLPGGPTVRGRRRADPTQVGPEVLSVRGGPRRDFGPRVCDGREMKSSRTHVWVRELAVGVTGFEPAASSSRTTRATKLRHTPPSPRRAIPRRNWPTGQRGRAYRSGHEPLKSPQAETGTKVIKVASGRQATRMRTNGLVPSPAETCSHEESGSPGVESAGWRCSPRARAGSMSQLVVSARPPGRQTCPPWVWPAMIAS